MACSRSHPPVRQHVLMRNGHTVQVVNFASHEIIVTPWQGAQPVRVAKYATVQLPATGGPPKWDLTVADAANGKTLFRGQLGPGGPKTLSVGDGGARVTGPETDENIQPPARPAVKP